MSEEESSYLPVGNDIVAEVVVEDAAVVDDDDEAESIATPVEDSRGEVEDEESHGVSDEDEMSVKSTNTASEEAKTSTEKRKSMDDSSPAITPNKKVRVPSVAGLTIPFRTVKKAMKLDPDTPIVQNEAAIMTTVAVELFVKELSKSSYALAKSRGRTTVRYEDVAEARANEKSYAFLEPLLP